MAKLLARQSSATNFKIGAVIAKGKKILGVGFNDPFKTHPKSNTPYQFIHAELAAIINARTDLDGASIYVYRAGQNERPLLSRPCDCCMELLKRAGIKTVFYSTNGGYSKENVQ
jgi:deoxycytidylate deaminase